MRVTPLAAGQSAAIGGRLYNQPTKTLSSLPHLEVLSMKKTLFILLILSLMVVMLAACGGGDKSSGGADADVAAGQKIFEKAVLGSNAGCVTCHAREAGKVVVGPSLAGIASKGEDFIRTSIIDPEAEITEGFPAGTMPANFKDDLSDQELTQLVKYLMTLK